MLRYTANFGQSVNTKTSPLPKYSGERCQGSGEYTPNTCRHVMGRFGGTKSKSNDNDNDNVSDDARIAACL